ncbi:MAG: ABC transporter ATP-binding protein [gamma proteobacterium symbiont of Bathyaustriella thionipta]|nr:ABC transporter ATP-binding protein [gamma proteobacterium symbiont of Bathyaustriella thionipta]MCU7950727.1 ABC transporter ATP-binding protein [gamma proteobacterium symbiont of Bathyaustriella thionipta]MCU7954268.1 ABC transporter ATP-binding protein [gamma proteobacterium symbiont of Bathyaustriella thionipta]MCU7957219.1 ABC transporter ATP-binding protein [gamma proteobacterium symbiont of Bathyaustriella thionipta]MCU7966818.1 ABC transporter ATP-binding protein [gamma proteobacteri
MASILEVNSLSKHYQTTIAVDNVSFQINKGQCFGMLGPNGAGKTTTIEIMEGITEPTSGKVLYKGNALGQLFRTQCGIQFQHTSLQEFLTVRETLKLFAGLYPESSDLNELIKRCNLESFLDSDNRKLSGGQRQRMLLAIALINNPEIVFLDEPTTGLDPQARHNFWDLIKSILSHGTTVILTTHYMEEAAELCDEIVIMDHGRIIAQGAPSELLQQHFSERLVRIPENVLSAAQIEALKQQHPSLNKNALFQHSLYQKDDWIEISTNDVNQTMKYLLNAGIDLSFLQIRQHNLEDLFLELTGKDLRI